MATTSPLRRLPVPDREPPFDDEAPRSSADRLPGLATDAVQGTLALAFVLPTGVPATPSPPPDLRLVAAEASGDPDEADFGPQPTARADLPEPRQWAGRFVQAVVEVLAGDRPAGQLVRWTSSSVYDDVSSRVVAAARRETPARGVVRSVHVTEPADGVAEVAALVRRGMRSTAIALRLEGMDGRWQCTALELG